MEAAHVYQVTKENFAKKRVGKINLDKTVHQTAFVKTILSVTQQLGDVIVKRVGLDFHARLLVQQEHTGINALRLVYVTMVDPAMLLLGLARVLLDTK
jgi:hypothetical protein